MGRDNATSTSCVIVTSARAPYAGGGRETKGAEGMKTGQIGLSHRILAGLALAACMVASPVLAQDAPVAPSAAAAVIDGWGPLKFGMSVAEAKAASDMAWDPMFCTNQQEIALKGCSLWADFGQKYGNGAKRLDYYTVTIDGMRFQPQLNFDRWGRLQEIRLEFREDVDGIQTCQAYFLRTMDNLERRYGRFASGHVAQSKEDVEAGYTRRESVTSAGTPYYVTDSKDKSYFASSIFVSDLSAFQEARALSRQNPVRGAARAYIDPSVGMLGDVASNKPPSCRVSIRYIGAHMPAPQPAGGKEIDF